MTYNELLKKLIKAGWKFERNGGRHDIYTHKDYPGVTIQIPRHWSKEVPTGTLNKILKDAGLK